MNSASSDKTVKRWIKPLPKQVINKIAAGEVVERPASVVKELVENSIDAGADRIEIIIEKSGTKIIKIIDNGCGIDEEQMEIAFARHATSKISGFKDLDALASYGFRGEALPSIASVSRMRMVSRTQMASSGNEIIYEGGVLQSLEPVAAPPGTTVEVENLFFNTPARRKFMKSEATEARHLSRVATAMAIGRYDIGFILNMNGRNLFSTVSGSTLEERVSSVLAPNQKFVPVTMASELAKVEGYIALPELSQSNRNGIYLFINNRFIHSATLSHALTAGYEELLPRGKFPVGALLLTVNPAEIDVNVHPTKIEVRLSRERDIHDFVYHAVKEALRSEGIIPSFKGLSISKQTYPGTGSKTGNLPFNRPTPGVIPGIGANKITDTNLLSDLYRKPDTSAISPDLPLEVDREDTIMVDKKTGEILEESSSEHSGLAGGFRLVGRFAELYLLLQAGDDLYIVDQHTAHERVLYEETLRLIEKQSINSQQLLFPTQMELSPEQVAVFEDASEFLNSTGFTVSGFGGRMIRIEAIPAVLSKKAPEKLFLNILDDIASLKKSGLDMKKTMAQSIACRAAVMSGDRLSDQEATHLLEALLKCENCFSCPHGRPTLLKITREDLNRQFGRG